MLGKRLVEDVQCHPMSRHRCRQGLGALGAGAQEGCRYAKREPPDRQEQEEDQYPVGKRPLCERENGRGDRCQEIWQTETDQAVVEGYDSLEEQNAGRQGLIVECGLWHIPLRKRVQVNPVEHRPFRSGNIFLVDAEAIAPRPNQHEAGKCKHSDIYQEKLRGFEITSARCHSVVEFSRTRRDTQDRGC